MERSPVCYIDPHPRLTEYAIRLIFEWPKAAHLHEVLEEHLPSVALSTAVLHDAFRLILEGARKEQAVALYSSIIEELTAGTSSTEKQGDIFGHECCLRTRPSTQPERCRIDLRLRGDSEGTSLYLMNKSGTLVAVLGFGRKGINEFLKDNIVNSMGYRLKQMALDPKQSPLAYRWQED